MRKKETRSETTWSAWAVSEGQLAQSARPERAVEKVDGETVSGTQQDKKTSEIPQLVPTHLPTQVSTAPPFEESEELLLGPLFVRAGTLPCVRAGRARVHLRACACWVFVWAACSCVRARCRACVLGVLRGGAGVCISVHERV